MYHLLHFIKYFFLKEDRHSLQSPFAFKVYYDLIAFKKKGGDNKIEKIRKEFLADEIVLEIQDLGAGSHKLKSEKRKVKDVSKHSNSPLKYNLLYQYFLSLTPAITCLELGTGIGVNTQYLSQMTRGMLYTIEGDPSLFNLASKHLGILDNVKCLKGNLDEILPELIKKLPKVNFALVDANHTYEATVNYFNILLSSIGEDSIIIIGDIYWSAGMTKAWKEICKHPKVTLSMDFWECGVLFFKRDLTKAHYILAY